MRFSSISICNFIFGLVSVYVIYEGSIDGMNEGEGGKTRARRSMIIIHRHFSHFDVIELSTALMNVIY